MLRPRQRPMETVPGGIWGVTEATVGRLSRAQVQSQADARQDGRSDVERVLGDVIALIEQVVCSQEYIEGRCQRM